MTINHKKPSHFIFSFHPLELSDTPNERCQDPHRVQPSPIKSSKTRDYKSTEDKNAPKYLEQEDDALIEALEMEILKKMQDESDDEQSEEEHSNSDLRADALCTTSELMLTNRSSIVHEGTHDYQDEFSNLSNGFQTMLSYRDHPTALLVASTPDKQVLNSPQPVVNLNYDEELNLFYDHCSSKYYEINN